MTWLDHLKNLLPINVQKRLKFLHKGVPSFFKNHFKKPGNITLENYLKDNKFFVFSFVRHPFDRLVSAYLDKIAGKPKNYLNERRRVVLRFNDNDGIPFNHFIQYVISEVKRFLNCLPKGFVYNAQCSKYILTH